MSFKGLKNLWRPWKDRDTSREHFAWGEEEDKADTSTRKSSSTFVFQPPEMKRVNTPPAFDVSQNPKISNYYFDFRGQTSSDRPFSPGIWDSEALLMDQRALARPEPESPSGSILSERKNTLEKEWFRVRPENGLADEAREQFEWETPEHLPGSPLCPLHPKYSKSGKGICVYHGRRKTSSRLV